MDKTFIDMNTPNDELYTKPEDALELAQFMKGKLSKNTRIVMPFYDCGLAIHNAFWKVGFNNIDASNDDFYKRDFMKCDIIISNPPFSERTKIFTRLFGLNKPFIMLQPLPMAFNNCSLVRMMCEHSDEMGFLCPNNRLGFIAGEKTFKSTSSFYSVWVCYKTPEVRGFIKL